jgi:dTDP-4-dehydrorhamnose reductase
MKYNRVFIAGGDGMLGSYVKKAFEESNVLLTDITEKVEYCDVSRASMIDAVLISFAPDLIINLAAMTNLEECETDSNRCIDSNYIGGINLYKYASSRGIPYIFISTAGVFGGEKDFYIDEDKPMPLSNYAKSKAMSEEYLTNTGFNKTWVFRAGWMMGGGKKKDKKFVNNFMKQVYDGKKQLHVVDDKLGTPTYCKDFADSIKKHLDRDLPFGLYNMVSKGDASRYDVAIKIKELLNLDIEIIKVDSDFFKEEYFAARPLSERLVNKKLDDLGRNYMRNWEDALTDYLINDYGK